MMRYPFERRELCPIGHDGGGERGSFSDFFPWATKRQSSSLTRPACILVMQAFFADNEKGGVLRPAFTVFVDGKASI
ncbi:hypothetical protein B0E45_28525 [Sinorhizobium sp. A49]|nr:hypothetical protein B0E45_28525 [Sinorhizobium sp. A49]